MNKSKLSNIILSIYGVISGLTLVGGILFTVIGTYFFDSPGASYEKFVFSWFGIPMFFFVLFLVSLFMHKRYSYTSSITLSLLGLVGVVFYISPVIFALMTASNEIIITVPESH